MKVCVETSFSAAHFIPGHLKCGEMHGHNYKVKAIIEGEVDKKTGMVVDFGKVKEVLKRFDHQTLNFEERRGSKVEYYMDHKQKVLLCPTAENLALYFVKDLIELGSFETVEVTIWETEDCSVTVEELGVKK